MARRTLRGAAARTARAAFGQLGYDLTRRPSEHPIPIDCDARTREVIAQVRPYTLTTPERMMALREAVRYIEAAGIEGPIVECGAWRGGSMMIAAITLLELGSSERDLYLFDTFDHMPEPEDVDVHVGGSKAGDHFDVRRFDPGTDEVYSHLPFEQVRQNLIGTGYPEQRLHFVRGVVEETIPDQAPGSIALCRLDTDWYRSTSHEMKHLYGRIAPGGVLIVDDYGEFLGCRQAVDEELAADGRPVMIQRVDPSCRLLIVPGPESGLVGDPEDVVAEEEADRP